MKNLKMAERHSNSVIILDMEGNIRLGQDSREFHDTIRLLTERGEKNVLLNMEKVSYVDSCGLGEIVAGYTTLQKNEGELKLLHLTNRVTELMVITKLLTVFEVFEDEGLAVKSFKNNSQKNELKQTASIS
jgi:anti-sigma B factor antagonist